MELGAACRRFHEERFRDLDVRWIEADEIWAFVYAKRRNFAATGNPGYWLSLAETRFPARLLKGRAGSLLGDEDVPYRMLGSVPYCASSQRSPSNTARTNAPAITLSRNRRNLRHSRGVIDPLPESEADQARDAFYELRQGRPGDSALGHRIEPLL